MTHFFFLVSVVLLDAALFGLIATIILAAWTVLKVKRDVVRNAKSFYERPARAAKNLAVTAKGIVKQEAVRAGQMAEHGKVVVACVSETGSEIVEAARSFSGEDIAAVVDVIRKGGTLTISAADLLRAVARQGASS
jgi:hypothetical protein